MVRDRGYTEYGGTGFRWLRFPAGHLFLHTKYPVSPAAVQLDLPGCQLRADYGRELVALAEHCTDWRPLCDWLLDQDHCPEQRAVAAALEQLLVEETAPC